MSLRSNRNSETGSYLLDSSSLFLVVIVEPEQSHICHFVMEKGKFKLLCEPDKDLFILYCLSMFTNFVFLVLQGIHQHC